jgi:hypothetical protein
VTEDGSTSAAESRRRGQGFPSLTLQDSVDAVVTAGLNGPDHSHDAFATYLGHKTANSGAFRGKLASLRDFGLITKRGDPDRVVLSELAQRLVLAAPNHYEEKQSLLMAFESCRVFGVLHADSAKNVPMDISRLRTQVLMRMGVAKDQVDRFVDSFVKSAVFAGIAESDGTKVTLLPREPILFSAISEGDLGTPDDVYGRGQLGSGTATVREVPAASKLTVSSGSVVPVALRQEWPIDGGAIEFIIRTPKAMPPAIYGLMAKMAEVAAEMEGLLGAEKTAAILPARSTTNSERELEPIRADGN